MSYMPLDIVGIDHSYAKPWSAHPDASNARPLRTLYMEKFPRNKTLEQSMPEPDLPLDVETVSSKTPVLFDVSKARSLMHETERQVNSLHDIPGEEWEEKINKTGWTQQQNRLFVKVNKILNSDRLARLAYAGNVNEAVQRRNQLDRTAKRIRQTLAAVKWDSKLIQWLHGVLLDNLGCQALAVYIEVLQTLKAKVPPLVERMVVPGGVSVRAQQLGGDLLANMIKKPWDPMHSSLSQIKMKKLPGNPLILVAPSGPTSSGTHHSKRMRYWSNQLSALGKIIPVLMHTVNNGSGVSIAQCLEHMIVAVKNKIVELRSHFVNRPIVLLGWNTGALVACHVALQEIVSAVVCLGFPYTGVGGGRGDADDMLLDCRAPTLFVIGQHANTCTIDDMEDLREKMRAENSLVVVGGSDDNLRMSRSKKKLEGVTQLMVDKAILEEVSEFLGGVLSQGPMVQESVMVDLSDMDARKRRKFNGLDDAEEEDYMNQMDQSPTSVQGRLSIAKALRARGVGSSSQLDSPQSISSVASTGGTPVRVKRKYTKRKGVMKPPGIPSPRKRFRSTPTPVASPVASVQSPLSLSAGPSPSMPGAPELTGLLRTQPGILPTFRILTDESGQKTALFTTPQPLPPTPEQQLPATVNLPSPAILGTVEDPPFVAYKIEDSNKKFSNEPKSELEPTQRQMISVESLLRSQMNVRQEPQSATITNTPISSLLSLAKHMPVQISTTTPASVASHLQQLLVNLSRSQLAANTTLNPSAVSSPLSSISSTQTVSNSLSGSLTSTVCQNQSGSPLQNSVPTLMSSLAKTSPSVQGGVIKKTATASTATEQALFSAQSASVDKSGQVKRTDYQEFVAPASSGKTFTGTQTLETIDLTVSGNQEETLAKKQVRAPSPLQITVNKPGLSSLPAHSQSVNLVFERSVAVQGGGSAIGSPSILKQVNPFSATVATAPTHRPSSSTDTREETLGKVSSMLESSPVTERQSQVIDLSAKYVPGAVQEQKSVATPVATIPVSVVSMATKGSTSRAPPSVSTSYTATPKQSLSNLAQTRTRRIRTPKQFDL